MTRNMEEIKEIQENNKEKNTIEGFTEFMRGISNNPNLYVPDEIAEKYHIDEKYRKKPQADKEE